MGACAQKRRDSGFPSRGRHRTGAWGAGRSCPRSLRDTQIATVGVCVWLGKAVYGLVNAPRAWWAKVNQVMAHLGWIASSLEPCLWRLMSKDGRILGLCCVHVNDLLVAIDESKSETRQHFDALKRQFQWNQGKKLTLPSVACIFIKTLCTTGGGEIRLDQHDYAPVIESLQCPSSARDDQALTPWEVASLHALRGSLKWLATQTMPWIQAVLSILQGEEHTDKTMRKLNKLLRLAQKSCSRPLLCHCPRAPCVVT